MASKRKHWAPAGRTREKIALVGVLALASVGFEATARAATVLNGTFTSIASGSSTLSAAGGGLNTNNWTSGATLSDWTIVNVGSSSGLAFVYTSGNQGNTTTNGDGVGLTGRFGAFSMYDPGNVSGATPHGGAIPNTSPGGGSFIVADGASGYNIAMYQTLTDLSPGTIYAVTFWYAAGQQYNENGNTTEGWQVSLTDSAQTSEVAANGTTIQDTPTQANISGTETPGLVSGGFQAWAQETFDFTADNSTEVLTFLSMGTPGGEPPLDLLSDVVLNNTVTNTSTPEPASLALSGLGVASFIGILWFRRKHIRKAAAATE